MTDKRLEDMLQKGESIDIEFKTSQFELNRDAFESICAMTGNSTTVTVRENYGRITEELRDNYGIITEENTEKVRRKLVESSEEVREKFVENTGKVRKKHEKSTKKLRDNYGRITEELRDKYGEKLWKNSVQILILIGSNPYMTAVDMAGKLRVSESTVEKHLALLKANNIIYRVGPNKGGYWQLKPGDDGQ